VLVNCAHSNLNYPTACGRALQNRGGLSFKEACKPFTAIQPGDIVVTESGNLFSKHVIHAVCRNLCQFKEASHAHEVCYTVCFDLFKHIFYERVFHYKNKDYSNYFFAIYFEKQL
jgi:O-acetyl-ADP-ribose deacetylase (regulator of RNase III)